MVGASPKPCPVWTDLDLYTRGTRLALCGRPLPRPPTLVVRAGPDCYHPEGFYTDARSPARGGEGGGAGGCRIQGPGPPPPPLGLTTLTQSTADLVPPEEAWGTY